MADKVKCRQGHENPTGYNFCSTCGEKISGGEVSCPHCNVGNDSGANFCAACGRPMREGRSADVQGMLWKRAVDDFATRVDVEDLHGILKKGLIVEQGTKALLFVNGALAETLMPGKYDLGGLASKLKNFDLTKTSTAILVDSGDVELGLDISNIYTKDPLNIDVSCKVIAQTDNPTLFFNNVMKGRKSYLLSELRSSLYNEMQNALNEIIGKKSVTDLNSDLTLKKQFEVGVENHLKTTFQRSGISFVQLRTIDYRFKDYDEIRGTHEQAFLLVSKDEAELQKRKRLFDVYDQGQLQEIFAETKEVEYREKRQKLWAEMRQLVNSDKMNDIKSADDLKAFIHEIDKGKLLRDEEIKDLTNTFDQSGLKRKFLLEKIGIEQRLEKERMDLVGKEENLLAQWEVKAKRERKDLDDRISKQKDIKTAEREIELEEAKNKASIKDQERDGDQKDLDMGLSALERMKKMKTQQKRDEMDIEAERLKRLSEVGIEALITASGKEQAEMLKELKKTEILKEMTEQQILALAAQGNPDVAKAIAESNSAVIQEKLLRERLADKDNSIKTMQDMFNKSLETQRDASVGVAQGGRVVYPPSGQEGTFGAGGETVICTKCKARIILTPGLKFCKNCGGNLFE